MKVVEYVRERAPFVLPLVGFFALLCSIPIVLLLTAVIWIPLLFFTVPILTPVLVILLLIPKTRAILREGYLKAYDWLLYRSEGPRRLLWEALYNLLLFLYPSAQWKTMNYGYAVLNSDGHLVGLRREDEEERFSIQLYHFLATSFNERKDLEGQTVIEVGSGRGGGLSFIRRYLNPKAAIGVDISRNQVRFCRETYSDIDRLQFVHGDSERLGEVPELKGVEADLVINVESSHCYGNFPRFVQGVDKLLKTGGRFAFADFREASQIEALRAELSAYNLRIVKEQDITANVLKSLNLDEERRRKLIRTHVHRLLQPFFIKFSGLSGSRINKAMEKGETVYIAFLLQKQ
eukprot:TRINITY_DN3398_c0_g1_i1.p1 TRINITY_DN3398_c0_g1~~TRINITY_DN3398_c0_g1_i1.p1  ORF type:complete len:348 (+),score=93.28 TRINITY_DN3398_c0_g1_i1:116-1159(+)